MSSGRHRMVLRIGERKDELQIHGEKMREKKQKEGRKGGRKEGRKAGRGREGRRKGGRLKSQVQKKEWLLNVKLKVRKYQVLN